MQGILFVGYTRPMGKIIFGAFGWRWVRALARWFMTYFSSVLPVKPIRESEHWLVFMHPKPSYALHMLLLPRALYQSFDELSQKDAGLLLELVELTQDLVAANHLDKRGYRLIVNGGSYQSFPWLHFHLVSGELPGK